MDDRARLQRAEQELRRRGVKDVKFFFDFDRNSPRSADEVLRGAADVLDAYLEGRCRPAARFEDSLRGPASSPAAATAPLGG